MNAAVDAIREGARMILHDQNRRWRDVVTGLDSEGLNWKPGADTNSIAVLVYHAFDSQRYHLANSLDIELERDRDLKFLTKAAGADELLSLIDEVEREANLYLDGMTIDTLSAVVDRPGRVRTGAWRALHALQHNGEHVGQAELTRQLWEQRS